MKEFNLNLNQTEKKAIPSLLSSNEKKKITFSLTLSWHKKEYALLMPNRVISLPHDLGQNSTFISIFPQLTCR